MKPPGEEGPSADTTALEMLASALKAGKVRDRVRNDSRTRGALDVRLTPESEAELWAILNAQALAAPHEPRPEKPTGNRRKVLIFKAKERCKP